MEDRHDQSPEDLKVTPEELMLYATKVQEMLQDLERREDALVLEREELALQREHLKERGRILMAREKQLAQEKENPNEPAKEENEPSGNLKGTTERLALEQKKNRYLSYQVQELKKEILPQVEQGLSLLQARVVSRKKLKKGHKGAIEGRERSFNEQKEKLEDALKLGAERARNMERIHAQKVQSLEEELVLLKKEKEQLQASLQEAKDSVKTRLEKMKEENSKLKETLGSERGIFEQKLHSMKEKNNEILRISKERKDRISQLEEGNILLHQIIELNNAANQPQFGQVEAAISIRSELPSQEEKKEKEEAQLFGAIKEEEKIVKQMEQFIAEEEKEIAEDKEKQKREELNPGTHEKEPEKKFIAEDKKEVVEDKKKKQEQLKPGTYEEELKKFRDHLQKLQNGDLSQKARNLLTAVEHGKQYNIASDQMLADTLFLTSQFLVKIINGEKINDSMCFYYQTLADNFNKNPLSKKIAGAMTAFLGAIVLSLQLPFMKYETGFNFLRKGIVKLQGTKSIAESSVNFLEEVKKQKLAK